MLIRNCTTIVLVCASVLAACDKPNAADESTRLGQAVTNTGAKATLPAAESPDPVAAAENASNVKRFADEVRIEPAMRKLVASSTTVRTMPLGRQSVTVLDNAGEVTEVAKENDYFLVVFSNPKDETKKLAGWIYKDGVADDIARALDTTKAQACTTGEVFVLADNLCATACTHDGDCSANGGVCDGNGMVSIGAHSASRAQYCIGAGEKK